MKEPGSILDQEPQVIFLKGIFGSGDRTQDLAPARQVVAPQSQIPSS